MNNSPVDIICIGAGISGAVLAERYASKGKKILVLEKRDHIGGNCYDYIDEAGILVSKYGPIYFIPIWKTSGHMFNDLESGISTSKKR